VLHTWRSDPDYKGAKIGVNLSIEHLLHKSSFEELVNQIQSCETYSELLVLELSELALTRFTKYLPNMLQKLQNLGVTLVLDNFGSHSGSLNHLFKYDFDFIKLNANLVNTFGMSDKYHRLVNSIVHIANEISVGVIANGVDDDMILQELNEIDCHFGQGKVIAPSAKLT
jgi:EAL domain-containing protein (putative c-di-GMP-specific phosphodiesterase class I)